ncbi:unannotated protein [freshwater metagenome]|uniref:Unannotated protein n=1 Tax=freshwater metagenome TaxID=449393 RepID=A0A6J6DN35_9ZZZZ
MSGRLESSRPVAGKAPAVTFRPNDACTVGLATTNVWLPSPMPDGSAVCVLMEPFASTVYEPNSVGVDMMTNSTVSPGVRPEASTPTWPLPNTSMTAPGCTSVTEPSWFNAANSVDLLAASTNTVFSMGTGTLNKPVRFAPVGVSTTARPLLPPVD